MLLPAALHKQLIPLLILIRSQMRRLCVRRPVIPLPAHRLHRGEIVSLPKHLERFENRLDLALDRCGFGGFVDGFQSLGFADEDLDGE
jgi:hypothetical protein